MAFTGARDHERRRPGAGDEQQEERGDELDERLDAAPVPLEAGGAMIG